METINLSKNDLVTSYEGSTLGEILKSLERDFFHRGQVVCEIIVNGMLLKEADEGRLSLAKAHEIESLSLKTSPIAPLLKEAALSTSGYVIQLKDVSVKNSEQFRLEDIGQAHVLFSAVIDGADSLLEMVKHIRNVASNLDHGPVPAQWDAVEYKFIQVLRGLVKAFQNRDFILVADLLEYEWTTALESWVTLLAVFNRDGNAATTQDSLGR